MTVFDILAQVADMNKEEDDVDGELIEVEDKQDEKEEDFKEIIEINRELNKK